MSRAKLCGLVAMLLMLSCLLIGCGGGGGGGVPTGTSNGGALNPSTGSWDVATARFHVDVKTGQVTVTPMSSGTRSRMGRAIFTGSAVGFNSSVLIDQPGDVGRKALSVSVVNRSGEPIGVMPNGTVTGLRVLFSDFANVNAWTDLRPKVTVSTLAGTGTAGSVDGPVASASFNGPFGVAADGNGNTYVSEYVGHRVRKIQGGCVSTLAGSGTAGGVDGMGTAARFDSPAGLAVNPVDGAVIVAEVGGNRIRRVTSEGRVTLVAGSGSAGDSNGAGNVSQFRRPFGVAVDSTGVIYVAEQTGNRIRKIQLSGDARVASNYTVSVLAGSGVAGSGDGVGTGASFNQPMGVANDANGNLYVTDFGNMKVRRVSSTGEVVTIAGSGSASSVDGSGETASFNYPFGIAVAGKGLVVSDYSGHKIRQITLKTEGAAPGKASNWQVATLAGTGSTGFVNGTGEVATFNYPNMIAVDGSGNLLIGDYWNSSLRKVTANNGFFPIGIASGVTPPTEAVQLSNVDGLFPTASGNPQPYVSYPVSLGVGVSSAAQNWWFMVPNGVTAFEFTVTVEAGTTGLASPEAVDGNTTGGKGSPKVMVRTLAGSKRGFLDGLATQARFLYIVSLAADQWGNVYVADSSNFSVRRISATGMVSTVAGIIGSGAGNTDGSGTQAKFYSPSGIAVSNDGQVLFVADSRNHKIRRIELTGLDPLNPASWNVSTIAGTGSEGSTDGPGNTATLAWPCGITIDSGGNVYVTEKGFMTSVSRVRRLRFKGGDASLATNWDVSLLAGSADGSTGTTDGTGSAARFNGPSGIATDRAGNVYVTDIDNYRIRKITPDGVVSTLAGGVSGDTPSSGYADGAGSTARFFLACAIAVDAAGYVYVSDMTNACDSANNRIRRVSPGGVVATVAGQTTAGYVDGPGDVARFDYPQALTLDGAGNLYVGDGGLNWSRIRVIQRVISMGEATQLPSPGGNAVIGVRQTRLG